MGHTASPIVTRRLFGKLLTVTNDAVAGAETYTPAMVLGGLITRDPNGGARADKMPLVTDLIAAMAAIGWDVQDGDSFEFVVRNTADAAETITLSTAQTGWTFSPASITIAQNASKVLAVLITSAAAKTATLHSIGSVTT